MLFVVFAFNAQFRNINIEIVDYCSIVRRFDQSSQSLHYVTSVIIWNVVLVNTYERNFTEENSDGHD